MPYFVNNNQFTAQNANSQPVFNPSPAGPYGYRSFGTKGALATNIDRIVLAMGDGENSNYTSSWWHYDIDNRQWTRTRPDPTNALGFGTFATSTNGFQDFFGADRGDNRQIAYNSATGKIFQWGGNAGNNVVPDEQDPTSFNHFNPAFGPTTGGYLYDPTTHALTLPAMSGWTSDKRYLSAGAIYEPTLGGFLQIMGESGGGGFNPSDTKIYFIAGDGSSIFQYHTWTGGVDGPTGRTNFSHQICYHSRAKKWILFGGNSSITGPPPYGVLGDTWMYDAVAKTWTQLASGPEARAFGFLTYDTQNNVCILTAGNGAGQGSFVTTTWAYSLEQNKWFNLNVNFSRFWGGAFYDPTRNIHLYTPGTNLTDTDVYTFRYAIPRASANTRVWYGMKPTFSGTWLWPEKHVTATYLPSATPTATSGKVYIGGGDSKLHTIPNGLGTFSGGESYQQNLFSLDLNAKFAAPSNLTAGTALEHAWCESGTNVMPKHWDFYGITADPKRGVLWIVPGLQETSSDTTGELNCANGETTTFGDDPNYLHGHIMQFNPVTKLYADVSTNNDIQFPVTNASNVWPWLTHYDALTDRLLRIKDGSGTTNTLGKASNLGPSLVWTNTAFGTSATAEMKRAYWAFDPQRRIGYITDREVTGHLFSLTIDTPVLTDLGVLPGTPLWPSGRVPADKNYTVFDYNARLLVYVEHEDTGGVVWTYDVDHPTAGPNGNGWTNISTLAKQSLDGGALGAAIPDGDGCCFDPDNNLVLLYGMYDPNTQDGDYYYWGVRLSDMGVAAPPINPVPDLVSINPATCVQGATVGVTCFGFGASFVTNSVVQWDGVAQPTTFVNADTLTFTVTSTLSAVLGPHNVTVFNPTPGGGTSLATIFTVTSISNPTPSLTSLSPSSTPFNSGTFCTITGSGFIASSVVNWDGAAQTTTFISSTQVGFSVTGPLASVLGAHSVTVTNPPPGGGTSNSLTFTVLSVTPGTQTGIFVGSIM